jgi:predicted nucleotidyltransferase
MVEPFWETNLIYQVVAGSQAYGLDRPESDRDLRGVCIPPRRYLLGLSSFEQWEHQDEDGDVVIYALDKFVRLALACNPNIIELLHVEPRHVLFINDYGQRLVENRHKFLSRRARHQPVEAHRAPPPLAGEPALAPAHAARVWGLAGGGPL